MANVGALATTKLLQLLMPISDRQICAEKAPQKLLEQALEVKYPALLVYCETITNDLHEKFRTFSGRAQMVIEVRMSQDRIEGLGKLLEIYVDTVTRILDQNRGDWGNGLFYTGRYEAAFLDIQHGGRNFLQTAKIRFEVAVSID